MSDPERLDEVAAEVSFIDVNIDHDCCLCWDDRCEEVTKKNHPESSDEETDNDYVILEDIPTATEAADMIDKIRKYVEHLVNVKN